MSIEGSVAVVTGVTSGVGRGVAITFVRLGAKVVGTGRRGSLGRDLERELAGEPGEFRFVEADVRCSADCERSVSHAVSEFGRLDVLINNAAIEGPVADFHLLTDQQWDEVLDTNIKGVAYCARAALRPMLAQQSGVIINIASTAGVTGFAMAHLAPYCTSKAAVIQLSNTIALEYREHGIRVNSIILGQTHGDTHLGVLTKYADYLGVPKCGGLRAYEESPKLDTVDIGRFLALLASPEAALLTAATIALDRGTTAGGPVSALTEMVVRDRCA